MEPVTAMIIASAIASGASAAGGAMGQRRAKKEKSKESRIRAKEMKRETKADRLHQAFQRNAELEANRLASSGKSIRRGAQSMQDTSDLIREALSI